MYARSGHQVVMLSFFNVLSARRSGGLDELGARRNLRALIAIHAIRAGHTGRGEVASSRSARHSMVEDAK